MVKKRKSTVQKSGKTRSHSKTVRSALKTNEPADNIEPAATAIDSAQEKTEQALAASEKKFRLIAESTADVVFILHVDELKWLYISPAIKQLLGYDPATAMARPLPDFVDKQTWRKIEKKLSELISDRKKGRTHSYLHQVPLQHKDGRQVWTEISINFDDEQESGRLLLYGACRDITERRADHEKLRILNERMTLANRAARMGIWDWDIINNRLEWDDNMYELYGLAKDSRTDVYESWLATVHPDNREQARQATQSALTGEKDYNTQFTIILPNGTHKHIRASGDVYRDKNGKPVRMVGVNYDITENIQNEEALRESEARFQNAFERAPIGMVLAAPDGSFIKVNSNLCRILGYSRAELLEKNLRDITHTDDLSKDLANIQAMLDGEIEIYQTEKRYIHKSGRVIWATLSSSLIRDEQNQPRLFIAHIQDITERKKTDQQRQSSEKQIRILNELVTDYVFKLTKREPGGWSMSILAGNFTAATGFSAKAINQPDHWLKLIHPEDLPKVKGYLTEIVKTKKGFKCEFRSITANGAVRWLEVFISPELDETTGNVIALYGNINNVTNQHIAEENLRRSEAKWRTMIETSPDAIAIITMDGTLLFASDKLVQWYGFSNSQEMVGRHINDFIAADDQQAAAQRISEWATWHTTKNVYEYKAVRRDGSVFIVEINAEILYDQNGRPESFFVVERDITERKRARQALEESENKFRTLFETMSQGVIYQDDAGRVTGMNPAAARLVGLPAEKRIHLLAPDPHWQAVHEDGSPFSAHDFPGNVSLQTGQATNAVAGVFNPVEQKYFWLSIAAIPEFRAGEEKPFRVFTTLSDITELKKALSELSHINRHLEERVEQRTREIRQLSNLHHAILQNAGVAIVSTSTEGTIQTFNHAAELMLGYTAEEVVGKLKPDQFHDPGELARLTAEWAANGEEVLSGLDAIAKRQEAHNGTACEWQMRRKDGTLFSGILSLSAFLDADGQPGGLIVVARDTTQEKQLIARLQESEERFYSLFYEHAAVMLIIDPVSGLIEEANRAAENFYGYDFAKTKSILISDINTLPKDQVRATLELTTRQHHNYLIFPHKLASGEIRTVEAYPSPIQIKGRRLLFSIIHDITDRVRTEEALRKSEAENRAILTSVPDLFFRLSRTGVFLNAPSGDPVNLYAPPEMFLGKHLREILPPEVAEAALENLAKAFQEKITATFEYALTLRGEMRQYENRMVAISDNEALSIVRDITERHNAEAAVQRSESLLKMMTLASPLAFYVTDYQSDAILYFNHNFCELWQIAHLEEKMQNKEIAHQDVMQACLPLLTDQQNFIDTNNQFRFIDNRLVLEDELRLVDDRILRRYSSQIRGPQDEYFGRLFIFEDVTKRRTEETFMQIQRDLATRLSATSDPDQALQWSLDALLRIDYVDTAGIYLLDPATGYLELAAHRNASAEFLADKLHLAPESPVYRLILSGKPVFADFSQMTSAGLPSANPDNLIGLAGISIQHEGHVIGSINLGSKTAARFLIEHAYLLETLATEIGTAVARISAERALLNSQQNFRMLFETIDDFVLILDLQGKIISTNPVLQARLGLSDQELQELHVLDLHPAEHRQEAAQIFQGMLEGRIAYCPLPLITKNGSHLPVETRVIKGVWDGKEVLYGISRDISERLKAEQALREAEDRWHFALEGSGDGVWDWNIQTDRLFYSRQWKSNLGYADNEISDSYSERSSRIHPDDRERCSLDIGRHLRGETEVYVNEHRLQHKDGNYVWILDRGKVVEKGTDGKPQRMIGTQTDITKLKLMEQSLRESVEREKELNDLKSRFISVASHEFRTPLATIMVLTDTLLSYQARMTAQQQSERLVKIQSQVTDLNVIIEDLLHLSRLQSAATALEPTEFDLVALIHEIVEELAAQTETVRIDCHAQLSELAVYMDKKQIRMIVANLVSNALKYSRPGQRVVLNIRQHDGSAIIEIADQGIGIPENEIKHLYTPFFRASNVGNISGTGLGLNIIKECIVRHGGAIDVQSVMDKGTSFTVRLPLRLDIDQSQVPL